VPQGGVPLKRRIFIYYQTRSECPRPGIEPSTDLLKTTQVIRPQRQTDGVSNMGLMFVSNIETLVVKVDKNVLKK
jgi:hypothetical protein